MKFNGKYVFKMKNYCMFKGTITNIVIKGSCPNSPTNTYSRALICNAIFMYYF